jgi:5'-methylthioadenosine phosphorylase
MCSEGVNAGWIGTGGTPVPWQWRERKSEDAAMIGFIGGSGIYDLEGLESVGEKRVSTPFGDPSDAIITGTIGGREVGFLPRHARGHRILPSEINHRANIFAFKSLGVEQIVSISAVGSLREDMRPRDIVLPDQYFDRTKKSAEHTFFGHGIVAHVSFADPGCPCLRDVMKPVIEGAVEAADRDVRLFVGGTYVNMEGPAFSTRAESNAYRQLGFDIIGMTSMPEAKLCREAEICYQAMAMVTDYDCWHETEEAVTVNTVLEHLRANTSLAQNIVAGFAAVVPEKVDCACQRSLDGALFTDPAAMPEERKQALMPIIGRYIG